VNRKFPARAKPERGAEGAAAAPPEHREHKIEVKTARQGVVKVRSDVEAGIVDTG